MKKYAGLIVALVATLILTAIVVMPSVIEAARRSTRAKRPSATKSYMVQGQSNNRETKTESSKPAAWVRALAEHWTTLYGGIPNYGELGKRLKPLVDAHGFEPVQERWQRYLEATEARFASASRFAQTYGSWDRAGGAPAHFTGPSDWKPYSQSVNEMERNAGIIP